MFKVQSSLFGGKTNFFENVALRPWVPKVEFLTVLGQGFQIKKPQVDTMQNKDTSLP
jgi:hypothetical protein